MSRLGGDRLTFTRMVNEGYHQLYDTFLSIALVAVLHADDLSFLMTFITVHVMIFIFAFLNYQIKVSPLSKITPERLMNGI